MFASHRTLGQCSKRWVDALLDATVQIISKGVLGHVQPSQRTRRIVRKIRMQGRLFVTMSLSASYMMSVTPVSSWSCWLALLASPTSQSATLRQLSW